jgi:hypothetical protein
VHGAVLHTRGGDSAPSPLASHAHHAPRPASCAQAAHLGTIHAILFFIVGFLAAMAARYVHGPGADAISPFFPLSPVLADSPVLFVMLGA